jgi:hypothetical protein
MRSFAILVHILPDAFATIELSRWHIASHSLGTVQLYSAAVSSLILASAPATTTISLIITIAIDHYRHSRPELLNSPATLPAMPLRKPLSDTS